MKNGYPVIYGNSHMQEPLDVWDNYVEKGYFDRRPLVSGHVGKYLFHYHPCEAFPEGHKAGRPERPTAKSVTVIHGGTGGLSLTA